MNFIEQMRRTTPSTTTNGAIGYSSTGNYLVDLNAFVSSYRKEYTSVIISSFEQAFGEDPLYSLLWLFYLRDVRGGLGERFIFRVIFTHLTTKFPRHMKVLLPFVVEFGRWDDLIYVIEAGSPLSSEIYQFLFAQLQKDLNNSSKGLPISLLAKWLPSNNSASRNSKNMSDVIIAKLNITPRLYRKMLSSLRAKINIVETKMSANKWNTINYKQVPSRANLIYNKAFLRHDADRRSEFLNAVKEGKTTINAGTLFPHDIVYKALQNIESYDDKDLTLIELWNALPNYVKEESDTLCVVDTSGSMLANRIAGTNIPVATIANAMGIYFSERSSGPFKNNIITFSSKPKLLYLGTGDLIDKLNIFIANEIVDNTNIEAVFDLILSTAISSRMEQKDLPKRLLFISDGEFDKMSSTQKGYFYDESIISVDRPLMDTIAEKFRVNGYQLPELVFWNTCGITKTIPIVENQAGIKLVSGFSPAICNLVLSDETNPLSALKSVLNSKRYEPIKEVLMSEFV